VRYQKLFISNIAHELRTPLSTIKTSTEVALLDAALPSTTKKIFGEIVIELDRISGIINNLLSLNTLTRPERMQFRDVDLGPIVDEAIRRHMDLARERDVKIITKMDAHRMVWGNPTALEQVVTNLVKNAISYTPRGEGGVVTVSVRPDYHGMVVLGIIDNGIGIAQEDLFHIFEPFYRADTSRVRRVRKSGSGLGLTIVNEIVRVHHGKITIESAIKRGTTVLVAFPAGQRADEDTGGSKRAGRSEVALDFTKGFTHAPQQ
jgi:signal transduction histidine kinase